MLTPADEGKYIRVVVSFMDRKGNAESLASEPVVVNTAATGEISITGMPVVGQELEIDVSEVGDEDSDIADDPINNPSYQWHRGATPDFTPLSGNAISSAIADTYTPESDDAGSYVLVVVSFTDDRDFSESIVSSSVLVGHTDLCLRTLAVRNAIVTAVNGVDSCALVTAENLGAISTLDLSNQSPSLTTLEAADFAGLTGLTELNLSDNGLSAIPPNVLPSSLTSLNLSNNSLDSIPENTLPASLESLDLSGNNLRVFPSAVIAQLTALDTLRLERNPSSAPVAFDIPYKLVRTDGGTGTPATVEVRLPAYVPGELRNDLMATVSASASTITDGSGTSLTSVAVGTAFTVTQTERAAVVLTATPPGHSAVNGMQLVAAPELALIGANTAAKGTPTISGTVQVDGDLVAVTTSITDDDGPANNAIGFTYQWHRGITSDFTPVPGTAIAGEESATYRLVDDDRGHYIRFVVSFADSLGFVETLMSNTRRLGDTDVCSRADGVQDALVDAVGGTPCNEILSSQLATITTLDLSNRSIASLQASDFAGLANLTSLSIDDDTSRADHITSQTTLTTLPADVFTALTSLETLTVSDISSLRTVDEDAFNGLGSLTELILSGTSLSSLPPSVFAGLSSLTRLELHDNSLSALPVEALAPLSGLATLTLQGNTNAPYSLPYELVRTDGGRDSPATVAVRLPSYVPETLRIRMVNLTVSSGATLSATEVAVGTDFTVTQQSSASGRVEVTADDGAGPVGGLDLTQGSLGLFNSPATGEPAISRTNPATPIDAANPLQVSHELAVGTSAIVDADGLGAFRYQWHRGLTPDFTPSSTPPSITAITGATGQRL